MDCSQFSVEEIGYIYKQLNNINLMSGQIEAIVSVIFIILTKCFVHYMRKGQIENIEQNKEAFFLAFDIISKNEERNAVHEIESTTKALLSTTIVIFLYNCSCFEQLKKYFSDRKNASKISRILYFEEIFRERVSLFQLKLRKLEQGGILRTFIIVLNLIIL